MRTGIRPIVAGLALWASAAGAAVGDPVDLQARQPRVAVTYRINADGTATEERERSVKILKQSAIEWAKRAAVSYSTSAQTAEVLAAYTRKADGRRIDVPKDNYQVSVNRGRGKDSPVYSDMTTMTVVFPDVDVGDTTVFSYRLVETEPLFPRHFSAAETFPRRVAYDDVRVRFEYPESLWVQFEGHGMKQKTGADKGSRWVEWTFANPAPVKAEREDYSVFDPDDETGYAFSTFKSYAQIAAAYGVRATPKAAVTARIQRLADELAAGAATPRAQAQALYTWVATNITYAGNCIGIGAVVPRDLDIVLDNKMGDCKDHATLLQALLAARGIASTQALVNAGSIYRLPKVPVVSTINHVINYIPSLDLYVDSTSDSTPFGLLPGGDQDKPVLWVQDFRGGTRTPAPSPEANAETMKASFKVAADGAVAGSIEFSQKGEIAAATRGWARRLTRDYEEDLVKGMFREQGLIGSGTFEKDNPAGLEDHYHYAMTFKAAKYLKLPGAGAFYVTPPLRGPGPVQGLLQFSGEIEKQADVECRSGMAREEYEIEFPDGLQVLSLPDDVEIGGSTLSYRASYRLHGKVLSVTRSLEDRTPGRVCSAKVAGAYKKLADQVTEDLKSQVLYKLPKPKS